MGKVVAVVVRKRRLPLECQAGDSSSDDSLLQLGTPHHVSELRVQICTMYGGPG
jgi:hypothetical protein